MSAFILKAVQETFGSTYRELYITLMTKGFQLPRAIQHIIELKSFLKAVPFCGGPYCNKVVIGTKRYRIKCPDVSQAFAL